MRESPIVKAKRLTPSWFYRIQGYDGLEIHPVRNYPADIRIIRPPDNPEHARHMKDGYWGEVIDADREFVVICSIHAVVFDKLWDYFMAQEESFEHRLTLGTYCVRVEDETGRERHKIDKYALEGLAKSVKYQPEE